MPSRVVVEEKPLCETLRCGVAHFVNACRLLGDETRIKPLRVSGVSSLHCLGGKISDPLVFLSNAENLFQIAWNSSAGRTQLDAFPLPSWPTTALWES
jgi:hypothetical protein